MDKQDWADRIRKEIAEVLDRARTTAFQAVHAARVAQHEDAGQKALDAVADDARLVHLNVLLCELQRFKFDSEIDEAYEAIATRVDVDVLEAQAGVAAWKAVEMTAMVNAMREPGDSLSAHHFQAWSQLDPEERERWRRVFSETALRLGVPCLCTAPAFLREDLGNLGLWKCSTCCAVWTPDVNVPRPILEQPWRVRRRQVISQRRPPLRAAEPVLAGQAVAIDVGSGEVRPAGAIPWVSEPHDVVADIRENIFGTDHPGAALLRPKEVSEAVKSFPALRHGGVIPPGAVIDVHRVEAGRAAERALEHERRVADIMSHRDSGPVSAAEVVARAGGEDRGWKTLATFEPAEGPLAGKIIAEQMNCETLEARCLIVER